MTTLTLPGLAPIPQPVEWAPTRAAGLARLGQFAPQAGRAYAATRNYDDGPGNRNNISALSPWIRHRLVTEREVLTAALARHSPAACEKFVQEVFWRGYFKGWLEQRPSVWTAYLNGLDNARYTIGADYQDAIAGRTGIDCFDAWTHELRETGYLHNHARMWFASIWIFTLRLPWQLGAEFFLHHLLDGDPASNTLSWRWVAGLHTKGKTYLARPDNIARYTNGRFDPTGLATVAEPLTEPEDHPLRPIPPSFAPPEGPCMLLLNAEDLCGAALMPPDPDGVLGLLTPDGSVLANDFVAAGLEKALADWGQTPITSNNWTQPLVEAAARSGIRRIVTAYTPIGPARSQLDAAEPTLMSEGIELVRVRRAYDSLVWPHAKRGFFGLKKQIPNLLRNLGLSD
ncbi:FAD-binding domain-containing protein [Ruegeria arenilitoris]|uniref:FAD-binding domain-containing protein n=1 Tax=Ruegeria arenilitoris TaxID=1173585 RepID=UPI001481575B|nr:FAD-binding domain-containing protein [Ruegeria arenilitoris]